MIDTTAALPVLHVFRGLGEASMLELIFERIQNKISSRSNGISPYVIGHGIHILLVSLSASCAL